MKKKLIAIIITIAVLAFPNQIETICQKAGDIFMTILIPAIEYIAQIAQ